jgi:hypothetical protein
MKDVMYTRMALLGVMLTVIGLVVIGCAGDEDDGDDDNGGGGVTGQIDRMAVPAVNTALIATARKDDFNLGDPSTDVANFQAEMTTNLTNLRAAVNAIPGMPAQDGTVSVATVISIVCPDVVTIDTTAALVFPNGRQLTDDVIDPVLQLALDRTFVTDGINANDNAFLVGFPYLAAANP